LVKVGEETLNQWVVGLPLRQALAKGFAEYAIHRMNFIRIENFGNSVLSIFVCRCLAARPAGQVGPLLRLADISVLVRCAGAVAGAVAANPSPSAALGAAGGWSLVWKGRHCLKSDQLFMGRLPWHRQEPANVL
jgi:hypothetical protein